MAGDDAILVCNRVADMPIPYVPADIRFCTGGCLERVWVARSSPEARPVCMQCVESIAAVEPDIRVEAPTAEQAVEVLRWLGARKRKNRQDTS
jgi:hypothetical protein